MEIKIIAKIWEIGNSHVITIPKDYIKHNIIDPEKPISLTIEQ